MKNRTINDSIVALFIYNKNMQKQNNAISLF